MNGEIEIDDRPRVVSIVGTRPEVIKMAPVILELDRHDRMFEQFVVATAQHRTMLDQVLETFDIKPDIDLDLMTKDQDLATFAARSLVALSALFDEIHPDLVLIQGDTTSVMTAALAAFYNQIRIGHVEAGLRSFKRYHPFPEELNRRVTGCIADLHFAPTERARSNLLREGICENFITVTGNTVVDAIKIMRDRSADGFLDPRLREITEKAGRLILVTAHRRENHGAPLMEICAAIRRIVTKFEDVEVVYPVHLNPHARLVATNALRSADRVHLLEPVAYDDLLRLMSVSCVILTDSGGIQEEAPSFGKPVLVLRGVTERPEVVESGWGKLVGTDACRIFEETSRLLSSKAAVEDMTGGPNPFGDGKAARRIVGVIAHELTNGH